MLSRFAAVALLTAGLFLGPAKHAAAEQTASWFLETMRQGDTTRNLLLLRLGGVVLGMNWANSLLENQGRPQFYCLPPNLVLTDDQAADMLRRQVQTSPSMGMLPFGIVITSALMTTFPCPTAPAASPTPPRR
jgi:hypothetical protein